MIELKNLNYEIDVQKEKKSILKNINLKLDENKIYVITGQNGSGKSTLVKTIMGIVSPTSGSIFLKQQDITNLNITKRAELGIAFAFQQPVTFTGLKVKDILNSASKNENSLNQNCELLSKVGLCAKDYIDRALDSKLSGGELKRIEIASVIARNASLKIFDEPEAGIDLWSFDNLINIFQNLKKESTLIIVSHQKKILDIADEIIVMQNGSISKMGNAKELITNLQSETCKRLIEV